MKHSYLKCILLATCFLSGARAGATTYPTPEAGRWLTIDGFGSHGGVKLSTYLLDYHDNLARALGLPDGSYLVKNAFGVPLEITPQAPVHGGFDLRPAWDVIDLSVGFKIIAAFFLPNRADFDTINDNLDYNQTENIHDDVRKAWNKTLASSASGSHVTAAEFRIRLNKTPSVSSVIANQYVSKIRLPPHMDAIDLLYASLSAQLNTWEDTFEHIINVITVAYVKSPTFRSFFINKSVFDRVLVTLPLLIASVEDYEKDLGLYYIGGTIKSFGLILLSGLDPFSLCYNGIDPSNPSTVAVAVTTLSRLIIHELTHGTPTRELDTQQQRQHVFEILGDMGEQAYLRIDHGAGQCSVSQGPAHHNPVDSRTGLTGHLDLPVIHSVEPRGTCSSDELLTYSDARMHLEQTCDNMPYWGIARLDHGASLDGAGYGCGIRKNDGRSLGHEVCNTAKTHVNGTHVCGDPVQKLIGSIMASGNKLLLTPNFSQQADPDGYWGVYSLDDSTGQWNEEAASLSSSADAVELQLARSLTKGTKLRVVLKRDSTTTPSDADGSCVNLTLPFVGTTKEYVLQRALGE